MKYVILFFLLCIATAALTPAQTTDGPKLNIAQKKLREKIFPLNHHSCR
jgi:hypothetical protein